MIQNGELFGMNTLFNHNRYRNCIFIFGHINCQRLVFFILASRGQVFDFVKCHIHACFILIKILNVSEIVWLKDVIDISISSDSSLWYFIVILAGYEVRLINMSRSFKHCLYLRIVVFFFLRSPKIMIPPSSYSLGNFSSIDSYVYFSI